MKRLVVVGNGMAGMACVEQILKHAPQFDDHRLRRRDARQLQPHPALVGARRREGRRRDRRSTRSSGISSNEHRPARRRPRSSTSIRVRKTVTGDDGSVDAVRHAAAGDRQLARGCRRSRASTRTASSRSARSTTRARCSSASGPASKAVVIGGGLLGLEAARGLQVQGCDVTVVHLMATLMERQLDPRRRQLPASARWRTSASACCSAAARQAILGNGHVEGVAFADGERARRRPRRRRRRHPAERRARPQGRPHRQPRHRRQRLHGDVATPTSSPSASASSTAASATGWSRRSSSRARCWRRRSPATRDRPTPARCRRPSSRSWASTCSRPATGATAGAEPVRYEDRGARRLQEARRARRQARRRDPRRRHVRQPSLHGVAAHRRRPRRPAPATCCFRRRRPTPGSTSRRWPTARRSAAASASPRARSSQAIHEQGVNTLSQLKEAHARQHRLRQLHAASARTCCARSRRSSRKRRRRCICALRAVRARTACARSCAASSCKSVQEVLEIYGNGIGCEVCKPALSYMLDMLWCGDHDEDRSARFINDRVHANIQKDGTFSVDAAHPRRRDDARTSCAASPTSPTSTTCRW